MFFSLKADLDSSAESAEPGCRKAPILPETNGETEGVLTTCTQKASLASVQCGKNWPTINCLGCLTIYISDMEKDEPALHVAEGRKWPASHDRGKEKNWVKFCIAGRLKQRQ